LRISLKHQATEARPAKSQRGVIARLKHPAAIDRTMAHCMRLTCDGPACNMSHPGAEKDATRQH